jgi:hypothetical protein
MIIIIMIIIGFRNILCWPWSWSFFVLVCPDHGIRSDGTRKPTVGDEIRSVLLPVSSVCFGTGRDVQPCGVLVIFHGFLCFFLYVAWLNLAVLEFSSVPLLNFSLSSFKIQTSKTYLGVVLDMSTCRSSFVSVLLGLPEFILLVLYYTFGFLLHYRL